FGQHWSEPLQNVLPQADLAREGLLRAGDLQYACFTRYQSQGSLLDCARELSVVARETASALAFATQSGNLFAIASFVAYRQFERSLMGKTPVPGSFNDAEFDEEAHVIE